MKLIYIFNDQLNLEVSSLHNVIKDEDIIVLTETFEQAKSVKHHKKKLIFMFSAMRHFANSLRKQGYKVHYSKIDDESNLQSINEELKRVINIFVPEKIIVTEPTEYNLLQDVLNWEIILDIQTEIISDTRFYCSKDEFMNWASDRKNLRMEYFYRSMRKKFNILMEDGKPAGGSWNFDSKNRESFKSKHSIPKNYDAKPDKVTKEVIEIVNKTFNDHFGESEPFHFAVTRDQALDALEKFIEERLNVFGDYQDAMVSQEPWMFHSHLSMYINAGLLLPMECVERAQDAYVQKQAPINSVEGFIRQILGWREFIRGVYWLKMPAYEQENYLNANRKLPDFFWTGNTQMNCMKQCIDETKNNAYAHHIQRLMVLGNFALIAGLDPAEVNEWYLIVYADAYQWVELPNVSGMALFADGGIVGSKPYASSGAYINKMSDYCKQCSYEVKTKNGRNACPFNYLYWDFIIRNQKKLNTNPRMAMIYNTLSKMDKSKVHEIQDDSNNFLNHLANYDKE